MLTFTLDETWLKPEHTEFLIQRINRLVSSRDGVFRLSDTNLRWQLDPNNDWFASVEGTILKVSYRYGEQKEKLLEPILTAILTNEW